MIKAYYVICNGTPLYTNTRDNTDQAQALLSGFLSAFQTFANNLDKSQINKIEMDKSTFFYSYTKPILSVIEAVPADDMESRIMQIAAERLARAFIKKYGEEKIASWCGNLKVFRDFDEVYQKVVNDVSKMLEESQKDFITKYFVEAASDENIIGAVVFDLEKDMILASDIPEEFNVKDFESFGSMLFSFINRLALQLKTGQINELILRASNYWIAGFKKGEMAVFMIFNQEYFGSILPEFVKNFGK